MTKKLIIEIICSLFIVLFTYAAMTKFMDQWRFVYNIAQSPLLKNYASVIAWAVPSVELAIVFLLAIKRFRLLGLYASFTIMVMFTAYIIAILQFSNEIPCSCGGVLSSLDWNEHLVLNISFILLGLAGVILHTRLDKNKVQTMVET